MKIVICEKCEGTGRIHYDVGTHNTEYEYKACPECKGSGRMTEKVSISHKPFKPRPNESTRIF